MTRIALALVGLLLAAGCPAAKSEDTTPAKPATPKEVVAAVRGVIEQWRQGYEVRSVDALAKLYTQDADSVVVQDGQPLIGWSSVEAMLKDRISRSKAIHVRLKDVQVTALGSDAAFAIATMTRELSDGVTTVVEQGALTLTLRKDPAGWRIVAEHYSYRRNG
jgi:uncharacterized protein (TIGR02246 family)